MGGQTKEKHPRMRLLMRYHHLIGLILSCLTVVAFIAWAELHQSSLQKVSKEDGVIETLTALLFGVSSICFVVAAYRSEFLKRKQGFKYFMTISWALLMFIFLGEEISWGQRIFDLSTPEMLKEVNKQNEITLHNIAFVDSFLGGKYRYLSIMMFITGLLLPVFALTRNGKKLIQKFAFPVSPLCFAPLFVGAYGFGKYYHPLMGNDAIEVRELLMSTGMVVFALSGVFSPDTLFRLESQESEGF